jgi:hypothetical protein
MIFSIVSSGWERGSPEPLEKCGKRKKERL